MQEVRDKLELMVLLELIPMIEQICVGFDNKKQEVFNLVQVLKTLFLYTQGEKDTVEEFGRSEDPQECIKE